MKAGHVEGADAEKGCVDPPSVLGRREGLTVPGSPQAPAKRRWQPIWRQGTSIDPGRLGIEKLLAVVMLEELNAWREQVGAEKLRAVVPELGNLGL